MGTPAARQAAGQTAGQGGESGGQAAGKRVSGGESSGASGGASGGVSGGASGGGLYYWPAYEMVKEGFAEPYLEDGRHPKPEVVQTILELFGKYYLPKVEGEDRAGSEHEVAEVS